MPTVSIVMPCLNPGPFLAPALESIFAQSFQDFELIVIDSASSDGSGAQLAATSDRRLRVVHLPTPCGVATPTNLGLAMATAPFIAMMDGDDEMHPDRLAQQVAALDQDPTIDALGSSFLVKADGQTAPRHLPEGDAEIKAAIPLMNSSALHKPTVTIRAAFLRRAKLFFPQRPMDHDNAMWLDMMTAGVRFANLPTPLLTYRRHRGSLTARHGADIAAQKTPLRAKALLALLPDLTGRQAEAIATIMEHRRRLTLLELSAGILAIDHACGMANCRFGADHARLMEILAAFRRAAATTLDQANPGHAN